MNSRTILALGILTFSIASAAQTSSAPAQAPAATSGPAIDATMSFIQEKLSYLGKVNYVTFWQNSDFGSKGAFSFTHEFSNVAADPNKCKVTYHYKTTKELETSESDQVISLHDVSSIAVKPVEQWMTEYNASHHQSNIHVTTSHPPVFVVLVQTPHLEPNTFYFTDATLADKLAKAMQHAVQLCGGGSKDDPF